MAPRTIGYIASTPRTPAMDFFYDAFIAGMRAHGWVESQNLVIHRRYAEARQEPARVAAEELVRLGVEVIVVSTTAATLAARQVTSTVPIVMTVPSDPVAVGLVVSLAKPGGNVTGLSFVGTELAGKQVDLLREAIPGLASIAVIANPMNASHAPRTQQIAAISRALGLRSDVLEVSSGIQLPHAFRTIAKRASVAAIALADATLLREAAAFSRLAIEHRVPVMYGIREMAEAGGLISYGASFPDLFRRAAVYVDKILRGAKPADLPVEQATKFDLVVNLRTAKTLGLTIPPSLLLRADHVIE